MPVAEELGMAATHPCRWGTPGCPDFGKGSWESLNSRVWEETIDSSLGPWGEE